MTKLFFVCLIGFVSFWFAAILIWIIQIRPYLERHNQKTEFLLFQSALLKDYRIAAGIGRMEGAKPWFLKAFQILAVTGVLFLLCGLLATIL